MAENAQGPSPVALVVGAVGLGGLGYVAYRYWYLPSKMQADLRRYAAQQGLTPQDGLARLGAVGCQAFGAKYGLPPSASQDVCSDLAAAAAQVARELPGIVGGTLTAVGGGVGAIGQGAGTLLSSVGGGAASGITALGKAPINIVGHGASTAYKGAKTVVTDVYKGTTQVVKDVVSAPVNVVKSVGKGVGKVFSSIF